MEFTKFLFFLNNDEWHNIVSKTIDLLNGANKTVWFLIVLNRLMYFKWNEIVHMLRKNQMINPGITMFKSFCKLTV